MKRLLGANANPLVEANNGDTALSLAGNPGKKIIRNAILAEKRTRLSKELLELIEKKFLNGKKIEKSLVCLILEFTGTYEPIE